MTRTEGRGLAEFGHPQFEVPYGISIPTAYALVARRYMHETGATRAFRVPVGDALKARGDASRRAYDEADHDGRLR